MGTKKSSMVKILMKELCKKMIIGLLLVVFLTGVESSQPPRNGIFYSSHGFGGKNPMRMRGDFEVKKIERNPFLRMRGKDDTNPFRMRGKDEENPLSRKRIRGKDEINPMRMRGRDEFPLRRMGEFLKIKGMADTSQRKRNSDDFPLIKMKEKDFPLLRMRGDAPRGG